jgi:hypothetical protein
MARGGDGRQTHGNQTNHCLPARAGHSKSQQAQVAPAAPAPHNKEAHEDPQRRTRKVMAAEPNEFALGLAPTTQTGNFTLLFSQHQKIMSRLL